MSGEILTMLGVGIALGLFIWRINAGMEQRLDKRIDRLADDHRALAGEISELCERMARVEGRMARVEERVGQVEERVGQVEGRVGQVESRMARVEGLLEVFLRRWDPDAPAAGQPAPSSP